MNAAAPAPVWRITRGPLVLDRPLVMGIVNLTPDSFSDGGSLGSEREALVRCERLLSEGADILDLGAESTRPGSGGVNEREELSRLLPVLRQAVRLGVPVSVDTSKTAVMQAALEVGADIINDVAALAAPGALLTVAQHGRCGVCLMHMHGEPRSMQAAPMQGDAVPQVLEFFRDALRRVQGVGIAAERIVLDAGIGFGKTPVQNFALVARQQELLEAGRPLLVGFSRKSSLAHVIEQYTGAAAPPPAERLGASVAAALLAVERGAAIVRVHDVRATVQALAVWQAMRDVDELGNGEQL
ncbi:MAG: dihydropteroate synthase [Rhodocyclaceae bacterium]|nr:dihydropteroate synthase [Rhodocyclaceae bacterium]